MADAIDIDLQIIDSMLDAIGTGSFPVIERAEATLRDLRRRIAQRAGAKGESGLGELLKRDPDLMEEAIVRTAEEALEFVREQMDYFAEIKKTRPLTGDERRFGDGELRDLLSALERLVP